MFYTVDERRETECFTPLMNDEKRDALHHWWLKGNGMLYTIDEWRETDALHHWWMERNGMLYTIDEWRETECSTPLMERIGMLYTIDEWRETEYFAVFMNKEKRDA